MNINLFLAENPNFKLIIVNFPGSTKPYHYKTMLDIEVGDKLVVATPQGLTVLEALEVIPAIESDLTYSFPIKWVVSKVDLASYEECIAMEREAVKTLNLMQAKKHRTELMQNLTEELGEEGVNSVRKLVRL